MPYLMAENKALGVALVPNREGIHFICSLNQAINKRYPSDFVLAAEGTLLPHVSLFQGRFPESQIAEIVARTERVKATIQQPISVAPSGINVWVERIFFLDLRDSEQLQGLHESALGSLNELRDKSAGSADPQSFEGVSNQEQQSIVEYGYPFALKAFRPHFTLGRSNRLDGQEANFVAQLERNFPFPKEIIMEKLVVFDVGLYGRMEARIQEIKL